MLASLLTLVALGASGHRLPIQIPVRTANAQVRSADPNAVQSLKLGLVLRDRAGLETLIAEQHDPASPLYRRWLTPAEFGDRFGVPSAQYEQLARTLERASLKVTRFPNRLYLDAQGTVAQVQRLLGVKLVDVSEPGQSYRSFQGTPRLSGELSAWIQSVHGLDGRARFHHRLTAQGQNTFGPQDLRRYYHVDPLLASGYGGQLSKVAMMGTIADSTNSPVPDEINWFYRNVSDSTAQLVIDTLPLGSSQPDSQPGLKVELEMDAELPTVAAPRVQSVTMVLAPNATLFPDGMNEIVNNHPDLTAVSISFGSCEILENQFNAGEITTVTNLVEQGVSEGIAWFSASGDYGVVTCYPSQDPSTQYTPSVDFPSGIPYMTAVGGTMYTGGFDGNGAIASYGSETTWNEFGQVAGGGVSIIFPKPVWQTGPGTSTGSFREVPDISLLAASQPGVAIVSTRPGLIDPIGNGTSDAAPLASGMFALINDAIGGCRLGSPNPQLYALGRWQYGDGGISVFHDITDGTISLYGVAGPDAGPAYDEATGLGSLDVTALAGAWPLCAPPPPPETDAGSDGGVLDDGGFLDDGGVVDAGPAPYVDAGYITWDGGPAQDAGPRAPYVQCDVLACDGGLTCVTTAEGPSQCVQPCDPSAANTCGTGNYCSGTGTSGFCAPGCGQDSDCANNKVCNTCSAQCVAPGNPDAGVGDPCSIDTNCTTGGICLPQQYGLPGGYCSADCSTGCGCPSGSQCTSVGFCLLDCDLAYQTGCRSGYVCDPVEQSDGGFRDVGGCLPDCRTAGFCFRQTDTCDGNTGICVPPGWVQPTPDAGPVTTSSSSGSTSGSTSSGSTGTGSTGGTTSSTSSTGGTSGASGSSGTSSGSTKKSGCGCGPTGNAELPWAVLLAAAAWASRRRVVR